LVADVCETQGRAHHGIQDAHYYGDAKFIWDPGQTEIEGLRCPVSSLAHGFGTETFDVDFNSDDSDIQRLMKFLKDQGVAVGGGWAPRFSSE
jgi:hypothetical protein